MYSATLSMGLIINDKDGIISGAELTVSDSVGTIK